MMKLLSPGVYLSSTALIIEGNKSLAVIDPGFDGSAESNHFGPPSTHSVFDLSTRLRKPVQSIFITHSHIDHIYNTRAYLERFPDILCIGHSTSPYLSRLSADGVSVFHTKYDMEKSLDGINFNLICTPGHSKPGDDLTIFISEKKIIQVGDLFQPQGPTYDLANSLSPVPYFHQGDRYVQSIEKIMKCEFDVFVTGHGEVLDAESGKKGLELTRNIITRISELAAKLVKENDWADDHVLCKWIYETIVYERNFDKQVAEKRMGKKMLKNSLYKRFDLPGIQYFVGQARERWESQFKQRL